MRKLPFLYVLIFFICSCKFFHKNSDQLLVTVYGDKLYFSDIKHLLSPDLNSSDSLNLVRQLCEKWAKEQLLLNKAKINLPIVLQNVKTQVESYENSLLIYSYQKELLSQKLDTIVGIDEIDSYYKNNLGNFVLNDHIAKVNYIKVKKEVPYLWKLKGLYYKNDEESKFKLEDYCYQFADDYYIEDDWVYVNDIINVLPDSYTSRKLFNENFCFHGNPNLILSTHEDIKNFYHSIRNKTYPAICHPYKFTALKLHKLSYLPMTENSVKIALLDVFVTTPNNTPRKKMIAPKDK